MTRPTVRERLTKLLNAAMDYVELEPADLKSHREPSAVQNDDPRWSATYGSESEMLTIQSYDTMRECADRGITVRRVNSRTVEINAKYSD